MVNEEVTPRLASTVLMVRDGKRGIEVLMITRNLAIEFASGALVFPGGRVDAQDGKPAVLGRCAKEGGVAQEGLALRIAGIRETYEEAGILLARRTSTQDIMTAKDLASIESAVERRIGSRPGFFDLAGSDEMELATDLMVPFAHWITPVGLPKRYDTHFFLAPAPLDQVSAHDGVEAVEAKWIAPRDALTAAEKGTATVVFATRLNLMKLARHDNVAAALEAARRSTIVTVCPEIVATENGKVLRIPPDAGYDIIEAPLSARV